MAHFRSTRTRLAISFGSNLIRAALSFISGLIVARGLGPEQYGQMAFLLGTFVAIRQLLDAGSSTAFFTLLSQRTRTRRFVMWYAAWLAMQLFVPLVVIGLLFPATLIDLVWNGEQRSVVLMAFAAVYLQSTLWPAMLQAGESQRKTIWTQGVVAAVALAHLGVVAVSWWQDWLGVRLVFAAIAVEWAIAAWVIAMQLRFSPPTDEVDRLADVVKEFGRYCLPLIPYSWLGFAYEFADRWLLQSYGGSVQQAYYAVAFQFGAIAAIATSSILNVFWKEIAEAHHQGNGERVAELYRKVSRGLFLTAAAVAGFLVPWSEEILHATLGTAYVGGATTLAIMFLYPVHQSMGQIGGTMLYATGHVRAQVVIGMLSMAASIVVTYFVLAPGNAVIPGLDLGSIGLAGKMVAMQFLTVNVIAVYLAKNLRTAFEWSHQLTTLLACMGVGWFAYAVPRWVVGPEIWVGFGLAASGAVFVSLLAAGIWATPSLAGLTRDELGRAVRFLAPWRH